MLVLDTVSQRIGLRRVTYLAFANLTLSLTRAQRRIPYDPTFKGHAETRMKLQQKMAEMMTKLLLE